ncbi:hypothetical protein EON77_06790 [bacterium]|nr:MAG: hypothetical protein EON77_06790 [bacterium]
MQKWMRASFGAAMAKDDLASVASALEACAKLTPDPAWSDWAPVSKAGAEAARKGDAAGTKASCRSCHEKYKETYRARFRTRAVP